MDARLLRRRRRPKPRGRPLCLTEFAGTVRVLRLTALGRYFSGADSQNNNSYGAASIAFATGIGATADNVALRQCEGEHRSRCDGQPATVGTLQSSSQPIRCFRSHRALSRNPNDPKRTSLRVAQLVGCLSIQ